LKGILRWWAWLLMMLNGNSGYPPFGKLLNLVIGDTGERLNPLWRHYISGTSLTITAVTIHGGSAI
jgi:hypothetical protein